MAWRLVGMKLIIVLTTLLATGSAAPAAQSLTFHDDGSYRFYYETGKEGGSHSRSEVRNPDGVVIGRYSYEDPDGEIREVNYRADNAGFVAHGDVGVPGAPKSQFPVVQPDSPVSATTIEPPTTARGESADVKVEDSQQLQPKPMAKADHDAPYHDEEDHDDMQDLALEESSSSNDPPEAFPPGFFLQKFQGLRRLPEPTKEEKPVTTEAPKEAAEPSSQPTEEAKENQEADKSTASNTAPAEGSVFSFRPAQPFLAPEISHHQEWASSMFHQPVYVFSYHQPDSYGYHYYF